MKSILISIKPRFVAKILNGEKTIEIRKTMPKCDLPIDVYIYCTKSNYLGFISNRYAGKVVAKFTLNKVEEVYYGRNLAVGYWFATETLNKEMFLEKSCLSIEELKDYFVLDKSMVGYAIHISDLEIFGKSKELSEFEKVGSYNNPTIKCKKKEQGRCNYGKSPFTGKWVGCEKARLTKAPQSWQFIESEE